MRVLLGCVRIILPVVWLRGPRLFYKADDWTRRVVVPIAYSLNLWEFRVCLSSAVYTGSVCKLWGFASLCHLVGVPIAELILLRQLTLVVLVDGFLQVDTISSIYCEIALTTNRVTAPRGLVEASLTLTFGSPALLVGLS